MRSEYLKKVIWGYIARDPQTKTISSPTEGLGWWMKTALAGAVLFTASAGLVHLDYPLDAVSGLVALVAGSVILWLDSQR